MKEKIFKDTLPPAIVLSVNPPYAGLLVDGEKTIEWRKKPLPPATCAFIYETKKNGGCGAIIGTVFITCATKFSPGEKLPFSHKIRGRVRYYELMNYSSGKPLYANEVIKPFRFDCPRPLSDFGLSRPPQSWCYLSVPLQTEETDERSV